MSKPFRLPVSALNNQRISTLTGSPASSGVVGIGVVGVMIIGNSTQVTDKDGRAVNVFPQTVSDPLTGQKRAYMNKRAGSAVSLTPQAGSIGNALTVCAGGALANKIISAFGATNSSLYDSSTQLVTNNGDTTIITGRATGITETDLSGTATLAISSSDSTAWYYQAAGVVTKITDGDFPGNAGLTLAGTFAHLAGFACIMTTNGRLYASDINSVTAWTANSYDSTSAYPDGGIGCIRRGQTILAFGRDSMEVWRNAGATPFPLVREPTATVRVGAIHANAITQIADTVFWIGSTPEGGLSVFKYDGQISRVSVPEIDSVILLAGASGVTLSPLRYEGRSFILAIVSGLQTYAYCIEENSWNLWVTASYPLWVKTASQSTGASLLTYMISNLSTSGKVYVINQASLSFTDAGDNYSAILQFPLMDGGTNRRKFWNHAEIVGDLVASSTAALSWSDDDYANYTSYPVNLDLSVYGSRAYRLGSGRRRGWVVTHSANTAFRMEALEGTMEMGTG